MSFATTNASSDALKCFGGQGCFINANDLSIASCWNLGGDLINKPPCTGTTVASFCQVSNATQLELDVRNAGFAVGPCSTSGASKSKKSTWLVALLGVLALGSTVVAAAPAPAPAASPSVLDTIDTVTLPFQGEDTLLAVGETLFLDGSAYTISEITLIDAVPVMGTANGTVEKRQGGGGCSAYSVKYTHTQVVRTGVWDQWLKGSGCGYTGDSNQGGTMTLNWGTSTSRSLGVGFDASTVDTVLGIIKGNAGFNLNYNWEKTVSKGGSWGCQVGAHDVVQIYFDQRMGWSDSQDQVCTAYYACGRLSSTDCGSYSAYRHADWPIDEAISSNNMGCTTGYDKVHC